MTTFVAGEPHFMLGLEYLNTAVYIQYEGSSSSELAELTTEATFGRITT